MSPEVPDKCLVFRRTIMENAKDRLDNLIGRYLAGETTAKESNVLENWYDRAALKRQAPGISEADAADMNRMGKESWVQLIGAIRGSQQPKQVSLWPRIAMIAAAVAAVVFGIWFYNVQYANQGELGGRHPELVSGSQDIVPGKNTATLTLANGKTITLSDAKAGVVIDASKLTYNDGSTVDSLQSLRNAPRNDGVMLTAATPRGGTYQVTLPDGTRVWLNAASSIKFPTTFAGAKQRVVFLSGEAYFEVFKNKSQPFVVNAKKMDLTVLGTHFNVSAYNDESTTKATLLEGAVSVSSSGIRKAVVLKPNEQATLMENKDITIKHVDVTAVVDWKNNDFVFKQESLGSVMKRVSRWYDVDVVYVGDVDQNQTFSGKVSRLKNISVIIRALQATQSLNFKIAGKTIYVSQ